ncbi:MAG: Gfo/Idh/MocA family oxidoreductase [Planctomycetota bacterium]
MKPFRAAVIGTGFIGPVHVEALRRAGVDVVAIIGSSPSKSKQSAERLGIDSVHHTLGDVLADDTIDSVHVTTPNRWHFEQVQSVITAGKHVLCEKPLAMDATESAQLVQLAKDRPLAAGVAYNLRFYPLCHEAAARIQQGSLGKIAHVTGGYAQDWLLHETDFNWRVSLTEGGALRAIADIGTHWLDLVQFMTRSRIVSVFADLQTVHPVRQRTKETDSSGSNETFTSRKDDAVATESIDIDTEDAGCVMLHFDNGAKGCLWVSQTTAGRKNCLRFEIAGTNESLAFNSETPNQLWIGHRDQPNELLIRDPALLNASAASVSSYPGGHNEGFPDTFKQLMRSFYGFIAAGDYSAPRPFPTFEDGHHELRLCDAILQSHRQQTWIDVSDAI